MDYFADNAANWDDRARLHAEAGYGMSELIADPAAISTTVRRDLPYLGDLSGARVCHLQSHLGTDTVSLARLGAEQVVGLDLSGESVRRARTFATQAGSEDRVSFVQANVYDAREALDGEFDLVYTTIGVLCWLPDIASWARVVASLLKPGGRLFLRDDHPMAMTIGDDISRGFVIELPYFEQRAPITWLSEQSYVESAEGSAPLTAARNHQWSHSIGEVITAVLDAGLRLDAFEESWTAAWRIWPDAMEECEDGFRLKHGGENLPLQFLLSAHLP
ncbi:Methyltransferase domain-containing protein [Bowdeniella nasicola]|uniref:Methyltransferase domain-containing protein n=1 Tax=Bowdeniella nasicola TaxID=208480 RepID=A0A1H3W307_9ACTO|nr:class I SAM-dependent methyltransferase [Bowdeniella nasicola]SDZ81545.1 Methyltransferase domain-containing protein [Bowdeniella nasicola]